ncbi:unnamed protein product [marine sediment metagenome]|uniref:Uncharacterized protein n=1 Tax=marine sediment metagenome TaxID=412755 RepID=X0TGG9_9ZZZZ
MTLYFTIMEASCGGVTYETLEKMAYDKVSYLSRAARGFRIRQQLEFIYNLGLGFHGEQKGENTVWQLQEEMRVILLEAPKTDVDALKKAKKKFTKKKDK